MRRGATRTVVALASAVVLSAIGSSPAQASEPRTGRVTANLSVSVSVARKCAVRTPALIVAAQDGVTRQVAESVSLSCVQSEPAAVQVGAPSVESALYAQLAREAAHGGGNDPLVVTVLF